MADITINITDVVKSNNVKTFSNKTMSYTQNNITVHTSGVTGYTTPPILEVMTGSSTLFNPLDSTTTYIGATTTLTPNATATARQFKLPTGTIKSAWLFVDPTSTLGTNEAVTYNLRNITDGTSTLLGTLTYDSRGNASLVTGLSIATDSSKLYSVEIVNPAFGTNPTNCFITTKLIIYP